MSVGENIKKYRKLQGLTQRELGEKCKIAESTIRRYELGKLNAKYETLEKIATALNTHALVLLDQISEQSSLELKNDDITVPEAYATIVKSIYDEIDIRQIQQDGYKYYEYILGTENDKIIISELSYDNIFESIENLIKLSINATKENYDSQDCWQLLDTIKDMDIIKIKKLIEYAAYLKSNN